MKRFAAAIISLILILLLLPYPSQGATMSSGDTYISEAYPTTNWDYREYMIVGASASGGAYYSLVRFDGLSSIPADAMVADATMTLFLAEAGTSSINMTVSAYRVKRDWRAYNADWYELDFGDAWNGPGCSDATDREQFPISQLILSSSAAIYSRVDFKLAPYAVQQWISGDFDNYGVLLVGSPISARQDFRFITSENSSEALHPQLTIIYENPGTEITATVTITDTTLETHELSSGNDWGLQRRFTYGEMLSAALLFMLLLVLMVYGLYFITRRGDGRGDA